MNDARCNVTLSHVVRDVESAVADLVLMLFPDEAAFQAWAASPEYLEISKDRKAGAEGIVLPAKGFSPQASRR